MDNTNRHIGVCSKCGTVFDFGKSGVFIHIDASKSIGEPVCDKCANVERYASGLIKSVGGIMEEYDHLTSVSKD